MITTPGQPRKTHLWQVLVELSLERISFLLQLLVLDLQVGRLFLLMFERIHQFISLIQHGDHELLEVGVVAELRGALGDGILGDGGHHVAHHVPHGEAGVRRRVCAGISGNRGGPGGSPVTSRRIWVAGRLFCHRTAQARLSRKNCFRVSSWTSARLFLSLSCSVVLSQWIVRVGNKIRKAGKLYQAITSPNRLFFFGQGC